MRGAFGVSRKAHLALVESQVAIVFQRASRENSLTRLVAPTWETSGHFETLASRPSLSSWELFSGLLLAGKYIAITLGRAPGLAQPMKDWSIDAFRRTTR